MSARDNILNRLRRSTPTFKDHPIPDPRHIVAPVPDHSDLVTIFKQKAELLSAHVYLADDQDQAIEHLLAIIGDDHSIMAWDFEHIPLENLPQILHEHEITVEELTNPHIRVGVTGVDAGLAMTGSIIVSSQVGKPRQASLLPPVHVAIIHHEQIFPHLDAWIAQQEKDLEGFRQIGNHIIITGASRTADIAMELVLGAHGPAQLHIIII